MKATPSIDQWQIAQIREALKEVDSGRAVSHERVVGWLRSWGTPGETKAPRLRPTKPGRGPAAGQGARPTTQLAAFATLEVDA